MRIRPHLTYANVMATFAVFGVVAGGGAYAASKIDTPDIANQAVTGKKLARSSVNSRKLAEGAVTNSKIADGSVATAKLSPDVAGVPLAGMAVGSGGEVSSWFNRLGGQPAVSRIGIGEYSIQLPGFNYIDFGRVIQMATPEAGGQIRATTLGANPSQSSPVVYTFDPGGNPADRSFYYAIAAGTRASGG